jgi:cell division protein FtsN
MAQARKKSSGKGGKSKLGRGPVLLLLGIGIGVGGLYLWQMVAKSLRQRGGLAAIVDTTIVKPSEPPKAESARKDPPRPAKPRYEFYTLLQNETVLPDREPGRTDRSPKPVKGEEGVAYVLQAGAFATFEEADNLKARLALAGLIAHIQKVEVDGKSYHRVRVGPYGRLEQLDAAADQLRSLNIRALRLKVRNERTGTASR